MKGKDQSKTFKATIHDLRANPAHYSKPYSISFYIQKLFAKKKNWKLFSKNKKLSPEYMSRFSFFKFHPKKAFN